MKKFIAGFSTIELLIAISLLGLIMAGNLVMSIDALRASKINEKTVDEGLVAKNMITSINEIKKDRWSEIVSNIDGQIKSVDLNEFGQLIIVDGIDNQNGIRVGFIISDVNRDESGEIVESGGIIDFNTKKITMTSRWDDYLGSERINVTSFYITNWTRFEFAQSAESDFQAGSHSNTIATARNGGALELNLVGAQRGDWCDPELTMSEYDIPGSGDAKTIFSSNFYAYLGTGGNASGEAFSEVEISEDIPPIINVVGSWDGEKVNEIFVEDNFAYLTTDNNQKEVIILDITDSNYQEVGSVNAPGSKDGESVFAQGNVGFMSQGDTIYSFDLTSKTGERSIYDELELTWNFGLVTALIEKDDYLYASLSNDSYEFAIIDVSDPSNMVVTSLSDFNDLQSMDFYISEDGTRVYLGAENTVVDDELVIIDIEDKNGQRPIISSLDTDGMGIRGVTYVEENEIVILGGEGGTEYQVVDVSDEMTIGVCGTLEVDEGIIDLITYRDQIGNAFSYAMTNKSSGELRIVLGGEVAGGGGNGQGTQVIDNGTYISDVFDSGIDDPVYYDFTWNTTVPSGTDLRIQLKYGDELNLDSYPWVGPDGTDTTYFRDSGVDLLPSGISDNRYVQYKVEFDSDLVNTSILEEVILTYGY